MVLLVWLIWLTRTSITLFWIMDVLNMPFMEMFDTTYPLNTFFWIMFFTLCGDIKILWNECGFCVNENYSTDIWTLEKWDAEHFQVCGNIFDNADLLEVE